MVMTKAVDTGLQAATAVTVVVAVVPNVSLTMVTILALLLSVFDHQMVPAETNKEVVTPKGTMAMVVVDVSSLKPSALCSLFPQCFL
jgi:hypothetical protein